MGRDRMTTSTQKQIALDLLKAAESGDAATCERLTTDDFHFQFMQRLESWTGEGGQQTTRIDKAEFIKTGIHMVNDLTRAGMNFKVELAIEEGPNVAIFGESEAVSKKAGNRYNNRYCWRFRFAGDKVAEFWEFCDTSHAVEALFG
jgi:ketosteroid isomerase-like protein